MLTVRRLGLQNYEPIWRAMQYIADHPRQGRADEIWLLSHKPIFTLGQAAKSEHVLDHGAIPLLQTDRGGQVTYHGPGQLVICLLLDVRKSQLGIRNLVDLIENAIVETLKEFSIEGQARPGAPGVYVNDAKIAALGLRVRNGRSYHGLSLNIDMDLSPFKRINPCGYPDLEVTQVADLVTDKTGLMQKVSTSLANTLLRQLHYQEIV
ncbi:MAG: lipoyl(octanoyl) transferase LipB [Gammaproteobacteria bacterium]|nr:lipoyl(octanoyl) transferase LipB [Gammaproteobacteria bacterium]